MVRLPVRAKKRGLAGREWETRCAWCGGWEVETLVVFSFRVWMMERWRGRLAGSVTWTRGILSAPWELR